MTVEVAYSLRLFAGETDLQAICDLLNLCDKVDKLNDSYAVEDLRLEFDHPKLNKERDFQLWHDANADLVAFGQTWVEFSDEKVDGYLYMRVHPEARAGDLPNQVMQWGVERLRSEGQARNLPAHVDFAAREYDNFSKRVAQDNGFKIVRYFFRMACPLERELPAYQMPEGYTLKHTESEAEIEGWVAAYNLSFIDHWNHHPMKLADHQHWMKDEHYNPERDLIGLAPDGTVAAFCYCGINPAENERNQVKEGWIDLLGVKRGHRKIKLGKAMLLAGLHRLKADGMDTALLGVDADNPTGALGLYESVGFVNRYTTFSYRLEV